MLKINTKNFIKLSTKHKPIAFLALFAAVSGVIFLASSQAATPSVDIEPEDSQTASSNVTIVNDPLASKGKAIQYHLPQIKPQIKGLVDRFGYDSSKTIDKQNITIPLGFEGVVNNIVVMLNWDDIQPSKSADFDSTRIDDAISEANVKGMHIKLRVLAGIHSPGWVKALSGGAFNVYDKDPVTQQVFTGTSPRFWTQPVMDAYSDLMKLLAAKYDNNPTISSVADTLCTTIFGEPFIRNYDEGDSTFNNFTTHTEAGLTKTLDEQCHNDSINIHNNWWKRTRTETALNPLPYIGTNNTGQQVEKFDSAFTVSWVTKCRQVLGERCIMGNNGFNRVNFGLGYRQVMGAVICQGNPPPYFQTRQLAVITDSGNTVGGVIQYAIDVGTGMLELPSRYQNVTTPSQLAPLDVALENNNAITCPSDRLLPNPT